MPNIGSVLLILHRTSSYFILWTLFILSKKSSRVK